MKKFLFLSLVLMLSLSLCACGEKAPEGPTEIEAQEEAVVVSGPGAKVLENKIEISAGGSYSLSGSFEGCIEVNTGNTPQDVKLILNGARIVNPSGSAIYISQAERCEIELAPDSENVLVSGEEGGSYPEAQGAVIFSEDDLDIEGSGSLSIIGYINNGIGCKDDLDIKGGSLELSAVNNGIRASESVDVKGGSLKLQSGNDGIKTSSSKKEGKGYVEITGGELDILSGGDGISAETELRIFGGSLNAVCSGSGIEESSCSLKAKGDINIQDGSIFLESVDHSIKAGAAVSISGGSIEARSSAGRGISAENEMLLSGGRLCINSGDDGIKALNGVRISGGDADIVSGADGIQAGDRELSSKKRISLSGGTLKLSADKKAFDAPELEISGGSVLALQNSGLSSGFKNLGSQSLIYESFTGPAECSITAGSLEISAGNAFKTLIYSVPELIAGQEYGISNGSEEFLFTAK